MAAGTGSEAAERGGQKFNFVAPADLAERIRRACEFRRLSVSALLREILENNLDAYLGESDAGTEGTGGLSLTIRLGPEVAGAVRKAARLWNLNAENLVQLVLARCVPEFVKAGNQLAESLRSVMGMESGSQSQGLVRE